MGNTFRSPEHWTDDQLMEHLYGIGPEDRHIEKCRPCQIRLLAMRAQRESLELHSPPEDTVGHNLLFAQRRAIYARLTQQNSWYPASCSRLGALAGGRRLASAAAALLVLTGSVFLYEQRQQERSTPVEQHVSDIELAQDVSQMAQNSEAEPTAPLQALFD